MAKKKERKPWLDGVAGPNPEFSGPRNKVITVTVTKQQLSDVKEVVAALNSKNPGSRQTASSWSLQLILGELRKEGYPKKGHEW